VAKRRPDTTSLVAGLAIACFGIVLLLDNSDVIDLTLSALAPLACALTGVVLLASGLGRRD
jgi:hypothetical protein